jgi:hypothetical protein
MPPLPGLARVGGVPVPRAGALGYATARLRRSRRGPAPGGGDCGTPRPLGVPPPGGRRAAPLLSGVAWREVLPNSIRAGTGACPYASVGQWGVRCRRNPPWLPLARWPEIRRSAARPASRVRERQDLPTRLTTPPKSAKLRRTHHPSAHELRARPATRPTARASANSPEPVHQRSDISDGEHERL